MDLIAIILLNTLQIYGWILIGRIILSFIPMFKPDWSPPAALSPIVDLIYGLTEPPLQLLRRVIPQPMGFPFDLSFIVLYVIVRMILPVVIQSAMLGL
ncbi:MAG TPA: YggT family protein [Actinomycetota bacterium]|nr:YggT family protein [Actinomycetota bacterium]